MASDETPVEQRLRLLHDNKAAFDFIEPDEDADAIDCGREAIRLLRDFDRDEVNPADWDVYRRALLARCTEGAATTRPMCKCGVYVDCHPVKANGPHIRACNAPSPVPPMPHEFSVGFRAGLNYEHEWGPEPDDPAQQAWNRYHDCEAWRLEGLGCARCNKADPPALVALVRVAAPFLVKEFDKHHCASMKCPWCDLVWPLLAYPLPAAPPVTDTPQGCPTCGGPRPCDRCTTRNVVDVDALKARLESERLRAAAEIVKLIADDSWAIAFQSLGQYRSALLKAWRDSAPAAPPQEDYPPQIQVGDVIEFAHGNDAPMLQRVTHQAAVEDWNGKLRDRVRAIYTPKLAASAAPPDPPGLPRYGVTWQEGVSSPLLTPMADGYWTPWHLAAQAIAARQSDPPGLVANWRPIETAPKRTDVLAGWADRPHWLPQVLQQDDAGMWFNGEESDYRPPTHWMPLPASPQAKED